MRLIDADALFNQLEDWRGDKEDVNTSDQRDVGYYAGMSRAMRFAKFAPTIDAVHVVHAKWVRPIPKAERIDEPYCSNCNNVAILGAGWFGNYKLTKFCPYCGARMDGEEHDAPG